MKTMYAHDGLERIQAATDHLLLRSKDGWVIGQFFDNQLSSIFQPVFEANELRVVGHAAYIHSESEHKTVIPPWGIFTLASEDSLLVKLDRLCRTVHAINYFNVASGNGNLFLNVQPRLLESVRDDHGQAFKRILDLIGIATSRVVIEIPVEVNRDWRLLKHVIGNYRSRGYQVAVNHDGGRENWMAGLSDLRPLQPDIVRLEASALLQHNGLRLLLKRFIAWAQRFWYVKLKRHSNFIQPELQVQIFFRAICLVKLHVRSKGRMGYHNPEQASDITRVHVA